VEQDIQLIEKREGPRNTDMSDKSEHPETLEELANWLEEKERKSRRTYQSGTRSENPRQTDINLGKLRAYRDARRIVIQMVHSPD